MPTQTGPRSTGRLHRKVALIVGGGTDGPPKAGQTVAIGNGRATAITCAKEGAHVMVADLHRDSAEETVTLIRDEGGVAEAVGCDATKAEDCQRAIATTVAKFGALHLLVNVQGIADLQSIFDVDIDTFDRSYQVNLRSNLLTMKFAVPEMVKAGGGAIVNVSSIAALRSGGGIAYEATKAAQIALSRSVAVAAGKKNIRVNTIIPGTINTPILYRNSEPGFEEQIAPRIPLGRIGEPWEIASSIAFLLSDDASYVTGTELLVDGAARSAPPWH